jgi:hypothetical protein
MTDASATPISVSRRIDAPAEALFGYLADPAAHPGIDGSGMLRTASSKAVISSVGDVFTMRMHNAEMGDYEIANHVFEFEPNRRIGWEPVLSAASRREDVPDIGTRNGVRWAYELAPDGPASTVVTEIYDCSDSPEWLRRAVANGNRWVESMNATLENLERRCREQ